MADLTREHADTAGATDTASRTTTLARADVDDAGAADSGEQTTTLRRLRADDAGATDTASRTVTLLRDHPDDAGAADTAEQFAKKQREHTDPAGASDAGHRTADHHRRHADHPRIRSRWSQFHWPHRTTRRLYGRLGPAVTDDDPGELLRWLDGAGAQLGQIADVARHWAGWHGWRSLLDPNRSPGRYHAWLAQWVGLQLPGGLRLWESRQYLLRRDSWRRGTPDAIEAEVEDELAGDQRVELSERHDNPYHFRVRTFDDETPDDADLDAAIRREKPAGVTFTVEVATGAAYNQLSYQFDTYDDLDAAFGDYAAQTSHIPPDAVPDAHEI